MYWISILYLTFVWVMWVARERECFYVHQKPIFIFIKCHEKAFCVMYSIKHNVYIILFFSTCSWKIWEKIVSLKKYSETFWERTTIVNDVGGCYSSWFGWKKKITIIITQSARHDLFQSIEIACCSPWWSCAQSILYELSLIQFCVSLTEFTL